MEYVSLSELGKEGGRDRIGKKGRTREVKGKKGGREGRKKLIKRYIKAHE